MTGKALRAKESAPPGSANSNKNDQISLQVIQNIKDITGASEEDIRCMLLQCGNNPDETTSRLLENPFSVVGPKKKQQKKQKDEEKKKESSKVVTIQRQGGSGSARTHRGRGDRGDARDRRGDERPPRGGRGQAANGSVHKSYDDHPPSNGQTSDGWAASPADPGGEWESSPSEKARPVSSPAKPAGAPQTLSQPTTLGTTPQPIRTGWGPGKGGTMADLFKIPPPPAAPQEQSVDIPIEAAQSQPGPSVSMSADSQQQKAAEPAVSETEEEVQPLVDPVVEPLPRSTAVLPSTTPVSIPATQITPDTSVGSVSVTLPTIEAPATADMSQFLRPAALVEQPGTTSLFGSIQRPAQAHQPHQPYSIADDRPVPRVGGSLPQIQFGTPAPVPPPLMPESTPLPVASQAVPAQAGGLAAESSGGGGDLTQFFGNMKLSHAYEERKVPAEGGPASGPPPGIVDRRAPSTSHPGAKVAAPGAVPSQTHVMHNGVKAPQQAVPAPSKAAPREQPSFARNVATHTDGALFPQAAGKAGAATGSAATGAPATYPDQGTEYLGQTVTGYGGNYGGGTAVGQPNTASAYSAYPYNQNVPPYAQHQMAQQQQYANSQYGAAYGQHVEQAVPRPAAQQAASSKNVQGQTHQYDTSGYYQQQQGTGREYHQQVAPSHDYQQAPVAPAQEYPVQAGAREYPQQGHGRPGREYQHGPNAGTGKYSAAPPASQPAQVHQQGTQTGHAAQGQAPPAGPANAGPPGAAVPNASGIPAHQGQPSPYTNPNAQVYPGYNQGPYYPGFNPAHPYYNTQYPGYGAPGSQNVAGYAVGSGYGGGWLVSINISSSLIKERIRELLSTTKPALWVRTMLESSKCNRRRMSTRMVARLG
eukprot:jgi/Botrbrau1/15172/Bobra.0149s0037.1